MPPKTITKTRTRTRKRMSGGAIATLDQPDNQPVNNIDTSNKFVNINFLDIKF